MAKKERKLAEGLTPKEAYQLEETVRSVLPIPEDAAINIFVGQKKRILMPAFVFIFQAIGSLLIKEMEASVFKVLWFLLCNLDYGGAYVGFSQTSISEQTNLSLKTVSNALRRLRELNVIISIPDPLNKSLRVYAINPLAAWKGKPIDRKKALANLNLDDKQLSLFPQQNTHGTQKILSKG